MNAASFSTARIVDAAVMYDELAVGDRSGTIGCQQAGRGEECRWVSQVTRLGRQEEEVNADLGNSRALVVRIGPRSLDDVRC